MCGSEAWTVSITLDSKIEASEIIGLETSSSGLNKQPMNAQAKQLIVTLWSIIARRCRIKMLPYKFAPLVCKQIT